MTDTNAMREAIERAAQEGYRVCAETRHVSLGDKVRDAILALLATDRAAGVGEDGKYKDMSTDDKAEAMADDCVGDPWELIGYFREKLRQSREEAAHAKDAAIRFAKRAAASPPAPAGASGEVADPWPDRKCGYCGPGWNGAHKHGCPRAHEDTPAAGVVDD